MAQPQPTDADRRIQALVNLPKVCPWCCQEQNQSVPPGTTNAMCERHRQHVQQGARR